MEDPRRAPPVGPVPPAAGAEIGEAVARIVAGAGGAAVVVVGLDHRIVAWSDGAERLFGWGAEEVVGLPIYERFRPDVRPEGFEAFMRRILAEGRGTETGVRRRRDGSAVVIEAAFHVLRDAGGAARWVVGISREAVEPGGDPPGPARR